MLKKVLAGFRVFNYLRGVARLRTYLEKGVVEAGCDEAGRGCLAGPVVAAAVILPPRWNHPLLNDSKQLTAKGREEVRAAIEAEVEYRGIGVVGIDEIDDINILNASFLAMHRALDQLPVQPEHLLIDGNRFNPYRTIRHSCIVGGDGRYRSIAAASILAKTHRDELMMDLHREFPAYGWDSNKGYGTPAHRRALVDHGITVHHRKSFTLFRTSTGGEDMTKTEASPTRTAVKNA